MVDILGNKLEVGDKILCVTRANYLENAVITEIREFAPGSFSANVKYTSGRIAKYKRYYQIVKIV
jgi:hypothetical protein